MQHPTPPVSAEANSPIWQIEYAGLDALLLRFAETPSHLLSQRITAASRYCLQHPAITQVTPAYASLLIEFDLLQTQAETLLQALRPALEQVLQAPTDRLTQGSLLEIPVSYTGEDLAWVAQACGLSVTDVIEYHSQTTYLVYALGFAPGFAYLGEVDARLCLPRRRHPRTQVPAGSLALADRQTAIYPQTSPGGWHLIGHTPVKLYDPQRQAPSLLQPGDQVRFHALATDALQQACLDLRNRYPERFALRSTEAQADA